MVYVSVGVAVELGVVLGVGFGVLIVLGVWVRLRVGYG